VATTRPVSAETGQLDPNINRPSFEVALGQSDRRSLPGDHRHSIKLFGAKDFKLSHTSAGPWGRLFQARSGGPTDYLGAHPIYLEDEVFILPRAAASACRGTPTGHAPGYTWHMDSGTSLSFTMDIFNLLISRASSGSRTDTRRPTCCRFRAGRPPTYRRS